MRPSSSQLTRDEVVVKDGADLVAAGNEESAEGSVVGDDTNVLTDGTDTPGRAAPAQWAQLVEHGVRVQQIALRRHLADARPLPVKGRGGGDGDGDGDEGW